MKTVIIKYNAGNIQSVLYALERIGVHAVVTADHEEIMAADKVIFPWVGEANSAMNSLKENPLRQQSEQVSTVEEVYEKMQKRFESEQKRYWELYKINNKDMAQFDLVIDTNKNNLEQVVDIIISEYKKWLVKS